MKAIVLALLLLQVALTLSVIQKRRRYDPEEDKIGNYTPIWYTDINGEQRYEDFKMYDAASQKTRRASLHSLIVKRKIYVYLFTIYNPRNGIKLSMKDFNKLGRIRMYNKKKTNVFIVHGWTNSYRSHVNTVLTSAILDTKNVNVFVVDWGNLAKNFYSIARSEVPEVGHQVGNFINGMIEKYRLPTKLFKIIGHSLGAHVAGIAGSTVASKHGPVNYIVGLDPAKPLFIFADREGRIDQTDGSYVEIIHTATDFLGYGSSLGHVDHYPNGGGRQPGCELDVSGTCSHARSFELFAESIRNNGAFTSTLCESWSDFEDKKCSKNFKTSLGGFNVEKALIGDYYLETNSESPYALKNEIPK